MEISLPIVFLYTAMSAAVAGGISWGLLKGDMKAQDAEIHSLKTAIDELKIRANKTDETLQAITRIETNIEHMAKAIDALTNARRARAT